MPHKKCFLISPFVCRRHVSRRSFCQGSSKAENFCADWDIMLNPKKSKTMPFGKNIGKLPTLQLDGNDIEWVNSWTYLGVTLLSHNEFNCCVTKKLRKFYRSANAILRIEGRSNELVMLQLVESHCLPILAYAIEVIHVDRDSRRKLRDVWPTTRCFAKSLATVPQNQLLIFIISFVDPHGRN